MLAFASTSPLPAPLRPSCPTTRPSPFSTPVRALAFIGDLSMGQPTDHSLRTAWLAGMIASRGALRPRAGRGRPARRAAALVGLHGQCAGVRGLPGRRRAGPAGAARIAEAARTTAAATTAAATASATAKCGHPGRDARHGQHPLRDRRRHREHAGPRPRHRSGAARHLRDLRRRRRARSSAGRCRAARDLRRGAGERPRNLQPPLRPGRSADAGARPRETACTRARWSMPARRGFRRGWRRWMRQPRRGPTRPTWPTSPMQPMQPTIPRCFNRVGAGAGGRRDRSEAAVDDGLLPPRGAAGARRQRARGPRCGCCATARTRPG
jgi:hypothetical protein